MSLKVEIQWKKFGGGRSEICNWLYLVLHSRQVKKKEKKSKEENIIYKRNSPLDYIRRKYNPMVNFSKFTFYIIYIYIYIYIDWSYDY